MIMKWKNIKDKLPEDNEVGVLIYGKLDIGNFYTTCIWYKGEFIDTDNSTKRRNITHWMPLPNPPKD